MARLPRIIIPGQPVHIIQRGNNRQPVFFENDDYWKYLSDLTTSATESDCAIHAYVLMTNHVHLLLTPSHIDSVSELMQGLGRRYVRYINGVYKRTGTLWEGRHKSCLIDTEAYLLTCSRYIELNPVRAKMVNQPSSYPWSSFHHNALGKTNALVTTHDIYNRLGKNLEAQQNAYLALFDLVLSEEQLSDLREGVNRQGYVGSEKFKEEIEAVLQRKVGVTEHGGRRKKKPPK